ncbi:MAG TPA: hypothetical protein VF258_05710 [Luteolibacter sp.]
MIKLAPEAPWMAGLRAARANVVPGLIVQGLMLSMLLAYYFYPPMRHWLDQLAEIKSRWSYGYTALSSFFAGAVIPELLRVLVFQNAKVHRANFKNLLFTVPFCCFMGVVVDFLYRCQAGWFGTEVSFAVVLKKVLVDQFLFNPLFSGPISAWLYDWKNQGFRFEGTAAFFTAAYYRKVVLPILFATWGMWFPIVTILYSLPLQLQIPLFGLALSLWMILYTWMSEQRARVLTTAGYKSDHS